MTKSIISYLFVMSEIKMKYCRSGAKVPMTNAGHTGFSLRKGSDATACDKVKGMSG